MKKLCIAALTLLLCAAHIYASVEIDMMTSGNLLYVNFEEPKDNRTYVGTGMENCFSFFFAPIGSHVDWGLMIDSGVGIGTYGIAAFIGASPIFRYNIDEKNAWALAAGVKVEGGTMPLWFASVPLTFSYKHWFIQGDGFLLGLNSGFCLDIPFAGSADFSRWEVETLDLRGSYYEHEVYDTYALLSGIGARFFFGICLNFGKRACDR